MIPTDNGNTVHVGDTVWRKPITCVDGDGHQYTEPIQGTVVYVHPRGRYHAVEFKSLFHTFRECFIGVKRSLTE